MLKAKIAEVTRELRTPAGGSPSFADRHAIAQSRQDFVIECHKTWKRLHDEAIQQIQFHDGFARREKQHPIGPAVMELADYQRAMWRRVNDAIVWSLLGLDRYRVKRLCLYKPRTYLDDNNARSALQTLRALNANPLSIAIWNDATSCVDIGDITYIQNGMNALPQFLELKEGAVNSAIVQLLESDVDERPARLEAFEAQYGKKGLKQYERVVRQSVRNDQAIEVIRNEKGVDPITGENITIWTSDVKPDSYDTSLNQLVREALETRGAVEVTIDGCLLVYANADRSLKPYEVRSRFESLVKQRFPVFGEATRGASEKDRLVCLNDGFAVPMAKPLYLRGIDSDPVAEVTFGDLTFRVFLYLDWDGFASLVRDEGGQFSWSSEKQARRAKTVRRELRPILVRGRVPQIEYAGARVSISDPTLVELFFDGAAPRTIIRRTLELAKRLRSARP